MIYANKLMISSFCQIWIEVLAPYKCNLWGAGLRTAVVLVEVMERVKTRLLICLERVAGLQIRVLHDPPRPDGQEPREKHRLPICHILLYYFFKPSQLASFFLDTHQYFMTGGEVWPLIADCIQKSKCKHHNPLLLSSYRPLKLFVLTLFTYRSRDSSQPRRRKKKDDSTRRIRNKCETPEHRQTEHRFFKGPVGDLKSMWI